MSTIALSYLLLSDDDVMDAAMTGDKGDHEVKHQWPHTIHGRSVTIIVAEH